MEQPIHPCHSALPVRQATRLVNEFQFRIGSIALGLVDRNFHGSATLLMIYRSALRAPGDTRISVNAIAASLQQPTETVRRAALALVGLGLCRKEVRGFRRPTDFLSHPTIVAAGRQLVAALDTMSVAFAHPDFRLTADRRERDPAAVQAAALDIYLSVFELSESRITSLIDLYVLGAITVLNAAGITHDPVLATLYGDEDTVPPDRHRRPASIAAIAALDGVPVTTVWRHATRAERAGALRKVDGGYLLNDIYMNDPQTSERSREKIRYVRRVFNDLAHGRYGT